MIGLMRAAAVAATAAAVISVPIFVNGSPRPAAVAPVLPPTTCPSTSPLPVGTIATVAGTGNVGIVHVGQLATQADLTPTSVAVATDGSVVMTVSSTYDLWRFGADGVLADLIDPAAVPEFSDPTGLAFDAAGDLFIASSGMHTGRIWKLSPSGALSVVAGTGTRGSSGNDGPATAAELNPAGVAVGPHGDLYMDDLNNFRTVDPAGYVHAFAGSATPGFSGDGGPATAATLGRGVLGVVAAADGSVYLGDPGNHRIRQVSAGVISTVAGDGHAGYAGDGGQALAAKLDEPIALALDGAGNLYAADDVSHTVRRIDTLGTITTIAGTGVGGYSGDCGPAAEAQLNGPAALAVADGVLYIVDAGNRRVRMVVL